LAEQRRDLSQLSDLGTATWALTQMPFDGDGFVSVDRVDRVRSQQLLKILVDHDSLPNPM
jgi:hypothetical protein